MSEDVKKIESVIAAYGRGKAGVAGRKGTRLLIRRVEDIVSISEEARERFASDEGKKAFSNTDESGDREVALDEHGYSEKRNMGDEGRGGKVRP